METLSWVGLVAGLVLVLIAVLALLQKHSPFAKQHPKYESDIEAHGERTSDRRRSERLPLTLPLIVRGESVQKERFQEETFTTSVNAHGALLRLNGSVAPGQMLSLTNLLTQSERKARVARLAVTHNGLTQIGIEFESAQPIFWTVNVVPDSWRT
jgi:hypothetical protein